MSFGKIEAALEALKRQDDSFYRAMVSQMQQIKEKDGKHLDLVKKSEMNNPISQCIMEHTGLKVGIEVIPNSWDVSIIIPSLLQRHMMMGYIDKRRDKGFIDTFDPGAYETTIDENTGRVTGFFTSVRTGTILVGEQVFESLTAEEAAAIFIHEVGHLYVYACYITTITIGAMATTNVVRRVYNENDYRKKQAILIAGVDKNKPIILNGKEMDELVNAPKDMQEVLITTKMIESLKARDKYSMYYDLRNFEQLSDAYAVKHCAGVQLAHAVEKIERRAKFFKRQSKSLKFITSIMIVMHAMISFKFVKYMLFEQMTVSKYDSRRDRVDFIKKQMIDDLKQIPRSDKKQQQAIVDEIKAVDEVLKTVEDDETILTSMYRLLYKTGRNDKKQIVYQKKIEELLYNDLFYRSVQLNLNKG